MLLAVAAVTVAGTGAFFSDTETSTGNVFTAGAIDLFINHSAASYNGYDCETCGIVLYSGDGENTVVNGTSTELTSFPFPAETVANPHSNWDTHTTAQWIWASDSTLVGDDGSDGNDTIYEFERSFNWNGPVGNINFNLDVGADNEYVIYLNGTQVGTGAGYSNIDSTLFSNNLQNGANTLSFVVTNNYNANYPNSNTPTANPGGLLYHISIERDDCSVDDLPDYMSNYQTYCELWESKNLSNESFFNFTDVKPQDEGTNRISMTVEDNESYLCLAITNKENLEHNLNNAEAAANDTTPSQGELGDFLQVMGWYSDSNGNTNGTAFGPVSVNDLGAIAYADSQNGTPANPGDTQYLETAWCLGDLTDDGNGDFTCDGNVVDINQTQTDEFNADLQFHAIQTRNNSDFLCADYLSNSTPD